MEFSQLDQFLDLDRELPHGKVPSKAKDIHFQKKTITPESCPVCGEKIEDLTEQENNKYKVKCVNHHLKRVEGEERYELNYNYWFKKISDKFDLQLEEKIRTDTLPNYVYAKTSEDIKIVLVVSEHSYEKTVKRIVDSAVREEQITLLLTPKNEINDVFELFEVYSVGCLVCPLPVKSLENDGYSKELLENAKSAYGLTQTIRDERTIDNAEYFTKMDKNPALISTELNYMEILRRNKELPRSEGDRLEQVVSAGFSHIGTIIPGKGGEEDSGEVLPDCVARIEGSERLDYSPTLCLIDAKSGKTGNFSKEKVEGKHKRYVQKAREEYVLDNMAISHMFVVFDIDGHQDIKFYDYMKDAYDQEDGLIIFHADALALVVSAYISAVVKNELELSKGSFIDAIRPLFNRKAFHEELKKETRQTTRFDDIASYPDHQREEYKDLYTEREGLMVVTSSMVESRLKECLKDDKLEKVLEAYF